MRTRTKRKYDLRLLAIDIDGTLLDSRRIIRQEVLSALKETRSKGILITLCSGRSNPGLLPIAHYMKLDTPIIGSCGSFIFNPISEQVIETFPLNKMDVIRIIEIIRASGNGIIYHEIDKITCEVNDEDWEHIKTWEWMKGYPINVSRVRDVIAETYQEPLKIDAIGSHASLKCILKTLQSSGIPTTHTFADQFHLEITRQGITKGWALTRLANYLNIPVSNMIVVGDSLNDLSMFKIGCISVAMGNAVPRLKTIANVIAPSCDESGLAWVVHNYIL
jgi:Cof subfamily protein (haloacid dehalogenase superfamily)